MSRKDRTAVVELSPEARQALIDEAYVRITTVDGVDQLDGYTLPPDNDEPFSLEPLRIEFMTIGFNGFRFEGTRRTGIYQSSFPNAAARASNITLIAIGHGPLYTNPDQL